MPEQPLPFSPRFSYQNYHWYHQSKVKPVCVHYNPVLRNNDCCLLDHLDWFLVLIEATLGVVAAKPLYWSHWLITSVVWLRSIHEGLKTASGSSPGLKSATRDNVCWRSWPRHISLWHYSKNHYSSHAQSPLSCLIKQFLTTLSLPVSLTYPLWRRFFWKTWFAFVCFLLLQKIRNQGFEIGSKPSATRQLSPKLLVNRFHEEPPALCYDNIRNRIILHLLFWQCRSCTAVL